MPIPPKVAGRLRLLCRIPRRHGNGAAAPQRAVPAAGSAGPVPPCHAMPCRRAAMPCAAVPPCPRAAMPCAAAPAGLRGAMVTPVAIEAVRPIRHPGQAAAAPAPASPGPALSAGSAPEKSAPPPQKALKSTGHRELPLSRLGRGDAAGRVVL